MLINSSWRVALDNIWGGIGFGKSNFSDIFKVYNGFAAGNVTTCYNMYLQLLIQTGIFGFIYFIIVSVYYFKMQFSSLSDNKRKGTFSPLVAVSSISSVGTVFVRGLTNSVWNDHRVLFAFFAVAGLSAAVFYFNDSEKNNFKEGYKS
jgi:O-antigen ligase